MVDWPVSKEMIKAGFKDSYRELHIDPLIDPGLTWTPRAATSSDKYGLRDRIDYIYYHGDHLVPIASKVVDYHPVMFPSDHAAVVTIFKMK
jgi:exonuclease III